MRGPEADSGPAPGAGPSPVAEAGGPHRSGRAQGAAHLRVVAGEAHTRADTEPAPTPAQAAGRPHPAQDAVGAARSRAAGLRAWAELLRVSALFTVPGDALAGAAAAGLRPNGRTGLALGASLCLYEAGMALNDWADRDEDAVQRPHRPIPSGRIRPGAALAASAGLTAAGLALAYRAGRPAGLVATALAGTVWAYDLGLKHTKAGPATMAAARSLDLLLGAAATASARPDTSAAPTPGWRPRPTATSSAWPETSAAPTPGWRPRPTATSSAWPETGTTPTAGPGPRGTAASSPWAGLRRAAGPAVALGGHTYAVTSVSRRETEGGSAVVPLAALGVTAALGVLTSRRRATGGHFGQRPEHPPTRHTHPAVTALQPPAGRRAAASLGLPGSARDLAQTAFAAGYVATSAKPLFHAVLNPSPPLTQRAVGGGIRAMIPLQAALAARAGAGRTAMVVASLVPIARKLARKVSPT